jgi:hypothetical protein
MKPQIIVGILCVGAVLAYFRMSARRAKPDPIATSASPSGSRMPTADTPYLRISVTKAGVVSVNDKESSLPELAAALDELASNHGAVLYYREAPEEFEPHPVAKSVIDLFVQRKLPIRLCRSRDFSDAIGPDGKLKMSK